MAGAVDIEEVLAEARAKAAGARAILRTSGTDASDAAVLIEAGWAQVARAAGFAAEAAGGKGPVVPAARGEGDLAGLERAVLALESFHAARFGTTARRVLRVAWRVALCLAAAAVLAAIVVGFAATATAPAAGDGLAAAYFTGPRLSRHAFERIDHTIDFSWGRRAPMDGMPADHFSVRWKGCLYVERGARIVLAAGGDDGIRVFVDGRIAIDDGGRHMFRVRKAQGEIAPGLHRIRVDYEEWVGHARALLAWSRSGAEPEPIPASNLVPPGGNARHRCPQARGR
jgi:hypothetical protein